MEDNEIIGLFFSRDERAISETDAKYGVRLRAAAERILSDHEDSRECANDTYLRVWNDIPPTRPLHFSAYLSAILRRIALDRLRRQKAEKRTAQPSEYVLSLDELAECVPGGTMPEEEYDRQMLTEALERFLRSLPDTTREIFLRRYWYFDSVKDIARASGAGESKIKSVLFRTRKALCAYLKKEGIPL